jgi:DNA-binding transcriptional LysR family regulator
MAAEGWMDRLDALEIFLQVASTGSLSETARRLGMAKSSVSKQVAALERRFGARLFNRTTRRLSLTEAGALLEARARLIVGEFGELEQTLSSTQLKPTGTLRVNAPVSFGILHIAPAIAPFLREYPGIEIDLSLNDRFVDLVNEGYDLAVRVGQLKDSSLMARSIASVQLIPCASPAYLARHGAPAVPEDLARHNCLCYSYQPYQQEWRFTDRAGQLHRVHVQGNLRVNNGEALLTAARQGLGIVLSPDFIAAPALAAGALVSLLPDYDAQQLTVHAAYPFTRHVPAKVRCFIDYLVRYFEQTPWSDRAPVK